jgi:ribosomal protein L35AE/L33A
VFWLDDTKLVFSSSIRYDRKIGAVIWSAVSIIHGHAVAVRACARPQVVGLR